jgi:hypothetical protein
MHPSDLFLALPWACLVAMAGSVHLRVERWADAIPGARRLLILIQKGLAYALIGAPVVLGLSLAFFGVPDWTWQWVPAVLTLPLWAASLAGAYGGVLP